MEDSEVTQASKNFILLVSNESRPIGKAQSAAAELLGF